MTTLIISDLHLGAANSRTDLLGHLLQSDFDRLILNGDTIDSLDLRRFRRWDWHIIGLLQGITRQRELVLIRGNHDGQVEPQYRFGSLDVLPELLGTPMLEECEVESTDGRMLVLHGDQFDRTLNLTWMGGAADWCYNRIQRVSRPTARWLKRGVKRLGGVVTSVCRGAITAAAERGYAGVITGHTHYPEDEWINGIRYLNSGCWVDSPCTAIKIDNGEARLMHWGEDWLVARRSRNDPTEAPARPQILGSGGS